MKSKLLISLVSFIAIATCLVACAQQPVKKKAEINSPENLTKYSHATFAAGCFWHEEALFESIKGVEEAISGYAGGTAKKPTYEFIESGNTGYAESVTVYYDASIISYDTLLKIYFTAQDPTQTNGQAPDFGPQYRSIAFYENDIEKAKIENYIKALNSSDKFKAPVAVQVKPLTKFWKAEGYHQNYVANNPGSRYVQNVSIPHIKHFQKKYPGLVKEGHFF